jgi:hypothetical protein
MSDYFYVGGMVSPYWYLNRDGQDEYADNRDSDTDMGGLYNGEFHNYFGARAMPITEQQYNDASVTFQEWVRWIEGRSS